MRRIGGVALVLGVIVLPSLSARAQQSASVEINNNYFSPAEIHVPVGGTVTWTNVGARHSVTSDDGSFDSSPACGGLQDPLLTSCLGAGDTFEHTFQTPETVAYFCRVHGDAMTGTVVVDGASTTTPTSTTSTTTATTSTATSSSLASDQPGQPGVTQAPLPSAASNSKVVLPQSIIRGDDNDDIRPLVLVAVGLAGITTVVGIVLVRRGRVPMG